MAQTISYTCAGKGQLAASFFFSRTASTRDNSRCFFSTLALHLAISIPGIRPKISKAIENDPLIVDREHAAQIKQLIVDPFLALLGTGSREGQAPPVLVVIDGLDECKGNDNQTELLSRIFDLTRVLPLKFLITSRHEPHITDFFRKREHTNVSLYGDHRARQDIYLHFRRSFDELHGSNRHADIMRYVPQPWPSDAALQLLVERSGGYFIYASTVLKYVDQEYFSPIERLQEVLDISQAGSDVFEELDKLYRQVLSTCPRTDLVIRILKCLFFSDLLHSRITAETVETVLNLRRGEVKSTLRGLHSVLNIKQYSYRITHVKPYHASFLDFLSDPSRAGKYFINPNSKQRHLGFIRGALDWFRYARRMRDSQRAY